MPQFLPIVARSESRKELAREWTVFLSRWPWDWFATMTFRGDPHPERAEKAWRLWCSKVNRALYGPRWHAKGRGVGWCRATELQQRGAIHFHALLVFPEPVALRRFAFMDEWNALAGYARIEPPKRSDAVAAYCAKYVVKDGEITVGGVLGGHAPLGFELPRPPRWSRIDAARASWSALPPAVAVARGAMPTGRRPGH
jgi:hypothetical protein